MKVYFFAFHAHHLGSTIQLVSIQILSLCCGVYQMLINSFENQTKLAEWFEHRNHYSVVVTCHKDLQRTEYKIQKNDYVYDMLKVKGSVTALVTCAKSLANNFPPVTTTDNKTVATGEQVGVVDSVGDALSFVLPVQNKVLKNVSFVRLEHDVIATWNAFACVAFYKFPIEYFSYLEDFKTWHKFIRFIEDKATDVSQTETIKHFVRSVLYPQNSLSCQDFDNINDALLCAMRSMPHRFQEFQSIHAKILAIFPYLPEFSDIVLDDELTPFFAESGIFDKAE